MALWWCGGFINCVVSGSHECLHFSVSSNCPVIQKWEWSRLMTILLCALKSMVILNLCMWNECCHCVHCGWKDQCVCSCKRLAPTYSLNIWQSYLSRTICTGSERYWKYRLSKTVIFYESFLSINQFPLLLVKLRKHFEVQPANSI